MANKDISIPVNTNAKVYIPSGEEGQVKINGELRAEGEAKIMMEGAPLDAVLALANRLPKHGRHLRAGDVVIIGSMLESPTAGAGGRRRG